MERERLLDMEVLARGGGLIEEAQMQSNTLARSQKLAGSRLAHAYLIYIYIYLYKQQCALFLFV